MRVKDDDDRGENVQECVISLKIDNLDYERRKSSFIPWTICYAAVPPGKTFP